MAMATAAATTEAARSAARPHRVDRSGPDRVTVALLAASAFLAVLALLAGQLSWSAADAGARRAILVRRVYQTTVIESVRGSGSRTVGNSVTQSAPSPISGVGAATRSS